MAREGFVVYHEMRAWLEPFGDAECGRILRAMLSYSMTGDAEELSGNEKYIWPAIREKLDRDRAAYDSKCKQMQANASKSKQMDADAAKSTPTKTETKTGTETGTEKRESAHARGEFGWVKLTDEQYARLIQDLGQAEADRCIRYVDESAQSTGNKNKWKDWNLTVRKCHRDGWGLDRKKPDRNTKAACSNYPAADPAELRNQIERLKTWSTYET